MKTTCDNSQLRRAEAGPVMANNLLTLFTKKYVLTNK